MNTPYNPQAVNPPPTQTADPLLYRMLIGGLLITILLAVVAIFTLAFTAKTIPEGLIAIGSAAVAGLVGLLVPSPTSSRSTYGNQ